MVTCRLFSGRLVLSNQRQCVTPVALYPLALPVNKTRPGSSDYLLLLSWNTLKLAGLDPAWLRARALEYSDEEIGLELGVCQATIRYHRRKHGIPSFTESTGNMKVRATGEARRRGTHSAESAETLDVGYFSAIDRPEKAYWIGVLATDGCVSENSRISLSQTIADAELVDDFATAVGAQMFVRTREVTHSAFLGEGKTRRARVVRFTSKQMAGDLAIQGIQHRKTKILRLSPCAFAYPAAYFRGCLDGDGTVGKINFKFSSGSEDWIDEAQELIERCTGRRLSKYRQVSSCTGGVVYVLQGVRGDQRVLEWIYSEEGGASRMERKFLRFSRYWLNRESSWWKDKTGARALVEALPTGLVSASSR